VESDQNHHILKQPVDARITDLHQKKREEY
jgi:hypothetical protein